MKEYYDYLREELDNYAGKFPSYILYVPDFFRLLCELMDENISKKYKLMIYSALAYFVLPNDVIPEDLHGPAGYIDDLFVCCYVVKEVQKVVSVDRMNVLWVGEEPFEKVLSVCFEKSQKELDQRNLLKSVKAKALL